MLETLRDHFIPHEGNENRPHFLRAETMRTIACLAIMFEVFAFALPTFSYVALVGNNLASVLPTVLGTLTNEQREALALPALKDNPVLDRAAQLKAEDMAEKGYFAHTSPEGRDPWYWLKQVGYAYDYAGENLAINFSDSADVTAAWMNSPTHRANIAKASYTEVGTGVARGMYEGNETIFVAQVYGNPAKPVAVAPPVPAIQTPAAAAETAVKETPAPKPAVAPTRPASEPKPVVTPKPKPAPEEILGAEKDAEPIPSAVPTTTSTQETPSLAEAPQPAVVAAAAVPASSALERIAVSPHRTTTYVFVVLLLAILGAVAINLFANRFRFHHFDLLTNGLGVAAVVGAIIVINGYVATSSIRATSIGFDANNTVISQE